MKAKLLMLLLPVTIADAEVKDLLDKIKGHIKEGTTPVLLDESDFLNGFTNKTDHHQEAYNVRRNFYKTIHTLNNVCGNADEKKYFYNFLRAYIKGKIDKPIIDTLLSITTDEKAWLNSLKATYLIKIIERLPTLVIE